MTTLLEQLKDSLNFISKFQNMPKKNEISALKINRFDSLTKPLDVIGIDGSYSFILNLSSIWLAVIRVGALEFELKNDIYKFKKDYSIEAPVLVSTQEEIVKEQSEVHRQLFNSTRNASEPHKEMVNEWRRLMEHQLASEVAKTHENMIIALDGTLSQFPKRFDYLPNLIDICLTNKNILVGISKDSDTHAFGSLENDENLLRSTNAERGYIRVPKSFEDKQHALLHGDVYFAKFHPASPKWFRVDIGTFKEAPEFVFSNLEPYTRSELCIGYPYPMLEAHRFVVAVRQFHDLYEDMILEILPNYNISIEDALNSLTHFEGTKRSAYHEFLDKITREVK